ncbi:MAG TPA: RNA polymerase sigma factor [Candidatus Acidoferrum sp.]|nr:RNA polymerase sigma factor [Candidatus Acidoferrum sp.]
MEQASPASSGDAELIARAQRGEEQAFEAIYNAHKRRVYYLCLRMIGNTAEAEELTQEAFMQVFRKIQTFRGDSSFSTWLHRVSVNVVLMKLRKKTPNEIPIDSEDENQEFSAPPKEFGAPDLTLTGLVDRVTLDRAVAELPPGCRQVFLLHDVMGCEHNEIAAMLDYSVGNSKSQLHKARMRLRKLLRMGARKNGRHGKSTGFAQPLPNSPAPCNGC